MNQKTAFLVSAILASVFLCFSCLVMTGLIALDEVDPGDGISFFNLLVDIAVGFFTVWGLFWAASEFAESAVKPVLRLLPGEGRKPQIMVTKGKFLPLRGRSPFYVPGWTKQPQMSVVPTRDPHILLDLYLENERSRAGRYVYLVVRVRATPAPTNCEFIEFSGGEMGRSTEHGKNDSGTNSMTISRQFPEDFVVYQYPVYTEMG